MSPPGALVPVLALLPRACLGFRTDLRTEPLAPPSQPKQTRDGWGHYQFPPYQCALRTRRTLPASPGSPATMSRVAAMNMPVGVTSYPSRRSSR